MMRRYFMAATSAVILVQSASASARSLDPTGKWVVDYRLDQCLASREYGSSENPVTFGIRPDPNGGTYLLMLAEKGNGPDAAEEQEASVDFGKGSIKSWLLRYRSKPSGSQIYQFRLSAADMEQARSASRIKLSPPRAPAIELKLELMPELIKSLEECTSNLKAYWNSGGESDGRIARASKGDLRKLFRAEDYPAEAFLRSQGGSSQLILLIDEAGKVAGCDVITPSGVPALDIMGCQVIRERARFTPATDRAGKPVRSTVVTPPIVWSMY